ncbi:hypothetical protein KXX33_000645 [Aspergillus fumigatus]|nr:hypothetical protein KXX63_006675 [Aspergillus fumigatus]KAH1365324.1 hypothetical protein KXX33_000645 [Aspergillus fumigatus]KAH1377188.1 hypothetical protein KXX10_000509 [Aspergillus fumigatus]KAH1411544.1 hypothetical protein KXX51_000661 [Aspergillus fumigatus]KAH1452854.1 hypothetical protein KXX58_002780 [Aspergillus fumigatus]
MAVLIAKTHVLNTYDHGCFARESKMTTGLKEDPPMKCQEPNSSGAKGVECDYY